MITVLDKSGITINLSNPKKHALDIERGNHLFGDHFCVHYYRMQFAMIPANMVEHLTMNIMNHIPWFPAKAGVSQHYASYTILSLEHIDI